MNEKQYISITEVSELLKIKEHVIRYWDSVDKKTNKLRFEGISTRLNGSKRRHFSKDNIRKLTELKNIIYQNGKYNYSLDLVKKIVNKNPPVYKNNSKKLDIRKLEDISENLKNMLKL